MTNIGYNNRWVRLIKDLLFVALCGWMLTRRRVLAVILGAMGLVWYGRDAYYQAKVLWQEKHFEPQTQETSAPKASADGGKITISTDAKEVDFEKE